MRLPPMLASFLYLLICQTQHISTSPVPDAEEVHGDLDWIKHLFDRQAQCAGIPCGVSSLYCCTGGSTCYTDVSTIARCGAPTAAAAAAASQPAAGWQYFTTTYVLTDFVTVVSTFSTYISPVTTATEPNLVQSTAVCNSVSEEGCGAICCTLSVETCAVDGRCMTYGAMTVAATTTLYSAPFRGTSGTGATATATVTPTTTETFLPASTAGATAPASSTASLVLSTGSTGLSGGAIAGIVIGVLAGIVILILICFCCVLKTGFDALLGILGLGRSRSRERVVVEEERYTRHSSASGGGRGGRSTRVTEKKSSGWVKEGGIIAGIVLALAGLWAMLGLRRKDPKPAGSYASYETYSDTYSGTGTSPSSASSDRRTRDTRRTRSERVTSVRSSRRG